MDESHQIGIAVPVALIACRHALSSGGTVALGRRANDNLPYFLSEVR